MADNAQVLSAKKTMRAAARQIRADAFKRYGAKASEKIAAHGIGFANPPPGAIVSAFSSIGDEIDPTLLLERLMKEGHSICLPVMPGKGKPLIFRRWKPGDKMNEAIWGIREPLESAPEVVPDVILAALLAYDEKGYRLGYGGGFYDRTIAAIRDVKPVTVIGIAYDEQRVECVPRLDHDQCLDWILTPSGPRRCLDRA